ncbi:MupG family TIM beta-alpha barrel fold protein [[Mycoplasma] testudinis]|uniref:MupG family TIM beta-alpha barrel fold protein n=1 Tax=[Mycoplasma] testudinis TaxID=33924 RepID=UPI00048122F8|nr:MupG family TIM beta-alpha barrel fold protein [[Mycoplasma] testudinis]
MKLIRSVYLSQYETLKKELTTNKAKQTVFISLHVSEELQKFSKKKFEEFIHFFKINHYEIIADVSKKTLDKFECKTIDELIKKYKIDVVRFDFGYSNTEQLKVLRKNKIAINASTPNLNLLKLIKKHKLQQHVFAIHNFYPSPQTGLDQSYLLNTNDILTKYGINKIYAFIPGDNDLRGPLFEGLCTLEENRCQPPYVSFIRMVNECHIKNVIIGDSNISNTQYNLIKDYIKNSIIQIPAIFNNPNFNSLYDKSFTCRQDVPNSLVRIIESRVYSEQGELIKPYNANKARPIGTITQNNAKYLRYSGELQICKSSYCANSKVNVIGRVDFNYLGLLKNLNGLQKFSFINPKKLLFN